MAIVNGTFNTDLSGWTSATSGNADAIWDNGRARLRVYRCADVYLEQTFVIDQNTLSFDFETLSDGWSEIIYWGLVIGGVPVISDTLPYTTTYAPIHEFGTRTSDLSAYVGQTATLRFDIVHSVPWCSYGDHGNTYLWIDNVALSTAVNIGNIDFRSSPTGADIYLDEIYQGITPSTIYNVPIGEHVYRLSLPGYYDQIGTAIIYANTTTYVNIDFTTKQTGCQVFNTVPIGSRVYVNNFDMRSTTPVRICAIPLGTHRYRLEGTFVIEKEKGCEFFLTVPKGATIKIDGVLQASTTPSRICDISPGTHTYRLEGTFTV